MFLFSLPSSETLNWLKSGVTTQLGRCYQCAERYSTNLKREVEHLHREVYKSENVDLFLAEICLWDQQRLIKLFQDVVTSAKEQGKALSDQSGPGFQSPSLCGLFEVLWSSKLCRSKDLQKVFREVFIGIQDGGKVLRVAGQVLPAMYIFSFSTDIKTQEWARKCFEKSKAQVTEQQYKTAAQDEVVVSCRELLSNSIPVEVFWSGMQIVLKHTDAAAVFRHLRDSNINLMDMMAGEISSLSKSLQAITSCLESLLLAKDINLWAACPLPAQEFGNKLLGNPRFIGLLEHPELLTPLTAHADEIGDLLAWTSVYTISQFGGNKLRVAANLITFLLGDASQARFPTVTQRTCKKQALLILEKLLLDTIAADNWTASRDVILELRQMLNQQAALLEKLGFGKDYIRQEWDESRRSAVKVILLTVKVDAILLWQDYVSLSTTDHWDSKSNRYKTPDPTLIWSIVAANTFESNMEMLQQFFEHIGRQMPVIDTIEIISSMSTEKKLAVETYNKTLSTATSIFNAVLRDVCGSWSSSQLVSFLQRAKTNEACIANLFSPNHETYQEALNLLKEAYSVGGRVEALRESFALNFQSTAQGFINVVTIWSKEGIYKSAARIVRTGSNILDVLFAPTNGLITTGTLSDLPELLSIQLWQALWRMLETTYCKALTWAEKFQKEELIEFLRDVLECSELLLSNISGFERAIAGQSATAGKDKQKELTATLLNECIRAIRSLTAWLRLNDTDLLQSCVNVVCGILQRLAEADIKVDADMCRIFEKTIANAKQRKNNLNVAQRTEIHFALSAHMDTTESPVTDVQVIDKKSFTPSSSTNVYDQINLAAARKATQTNGIRPDKSKLNSSIVRPVAPLSAKTSTKTMTPAERAEFLKKRSALPEILRSKKPVAKNASAGAVTKVDSSTSESDSDSEVEGLFSNDAKPVQRIVEKRKTQAMEAPHLSVVRDARSERNRIEQNLRARTNPDLTGLHLRLLGWHPLHDGDFPPDTLKEDYVKLVDSYQTSAKYRKSIEPLFMLETWQHIVTDREAIRNKDKFELILQSRSAVDQFVDLVATMSMNIWKELGLSDPDLLILSTSNDFTPSAMQNCEACLAKVQHIYRKKDVVEIGLRTVPNPGMVKHLRPATQLHAVKTGGLTPTHREYATLQALPYYDLCDEIVMGRPTKGSAAHPDSVKSLMKSYVLNEPQARAVDAAMHNPGFTLIQGPPGTGKTKTILGMVAAFLAASRAHGTVISIPGQKAVAKKDEAIKKKILLCAPSNAAVDEIVLRLKAGIFDAKGERYIPKIVRMGMSDAINNNVRDVTLDALLDDILNRVDDKATGSTANNPAEVRDKLNETLKERDIQRALLDTARKEGKDTEKIAEEIKRLNIRKTQLGEKLDDLRDRQSQKARAKDIERKRFQTQILAEADIICATLSGSGHELMASISVNFDTVIIDEACQTTELNALIPLKYGCTRCIMVGDPNQLPPTVLSTEAVNFAYNESLFVRMQKNNPNAVRLLAIQYRMHSSISSFPSKQFYNGELLDGPEVDTHTARSWHSSSIFGTYRFFDVAGREEESRGHSVYNMTEARVALALVKKLQEDFFDVDFDGRIGIITPYKEQHNTIKRLFQQEYGQSVLSTVDFNTIDGFQGQEKDIIIFSCVRANPNRGIGFLSDIRRMNVGLTRAKSSIFILGHTAALRTNKTWRALLDDAHDRKLVTNVDKNTFTVKTRTKQDVKRERSLSPERVEKKVKPEPKTHSVFTDFAAKPVKAAVAAKVATQHKVTEPATKEVKVKKEVDDDMHDHIKVKPEPVEEVIQPQNIKAEAHDDEIPIKADPDAATTQKQNRPLKRKAEPSLFIKRKPHR